MKSIVKALLYLLILVVIGVGGAMMIQTKAAAEGGNPDSRQTEITVSVTEYRWWLARWSSNEITCVVGVESEGLPRSLDVLADCGDTLYQEWVTTPPCRAAANEGDTRTCAGLYLFLVDQVPVEKSLVIDLPKPSIWLSLQGCSPQPPLNRCDEIPTLILAGDEPLPNEAITAMHVLTGDQIIDCAGDRCEIPLQPTAFDGELIEFWAISTFGDESEHYFARVRVVDTGVAPESGVGDWFVDIISSQWRGDAVSSCAAMWEVFPPIDGLPEWLSTPADHTGLASNTPFVFLAGELIRAGIVDAGSCVDHGLLGNGGASPCGIEAARSTVNDWQNQFDAEIYTAAEARSIPAQLLKNLFAQESQFWPGRTTMEEEFGLGQLTALGADTTLLWNTAFFDQFCPLVLNEDTCGRGYAFIGSENQELLRGALATQSGALCPTCAAGVDLAHAQNTVNLFAETIVANCAQVSFIVSDITGEMPGEVSRYEDLWRFTLANYNAGPSCLAKALNLSWRKQRRMDWPTAAGEFTSGCAAAIEYVERVTRDRAPADADFLPSPMPTATPFFTPNPNAPPPPPSATPTPASPGGYPPPTETGGYPPPEPTGTPFGYP